MDDINTRARELAIEIVDGTLGCLIEFAGSQRVHQQQWDIAEEKIADVLRDTIRRCAAICAEIAALNRPNCAQECETAILGMLEEGPRS